MYLSFSFLSLVHAVAKLSSRLWKNNELLGVRIGSVFFHSTQQDDRHDFFGSCDAILSAAFPITLECRIRPAFSWWCSWTVK